VEEEMAIASDIAPLIREFIVREFLFDDSSALPDDDTSLLDSGIMDSTGVLTLIMFLEEQFEITVADDDVVPEHLDAISNITRYVMSQRAM
jgi:acyl carrier protein